MSLLAEYYPQIRHAHIGFVTLSGSLFALRGAAVLAGAHWPMTPLARHGSVAIDTLLIAAALMLLSVLDLNPFAVPWLLTKLSLLVVYIGLGSLALKYAPTRSAKAAAYVASLLVFGYMVSVALAHHPLGVFAAT